jgi:hypothetical protein
METPGLKKHKTECEEDGGSWVSACPKGEKTKCIDEEDKDVLYNVYAEGWTCGDLDLKNADGSEEIVSTGGACYPYAPQENAMFLTCIGLPELSTSDVRLTCSSLKAPFVQECPVNANLICYKPEEEEKIIYHFYGEVISLLTCEDFLF